MKSTDRQKLLGRLVYGTLTLALMAAATSTCHAGFPYGRGIRGPVYHYGYGPSCGPRVPTTKTMQNNLWQSHQWKGEYPVCQPLYAPNFGHFETQWHRFPGEECSEGPMMSVKPF